MQGFLFYKGEVVLVKLARLRLGGFFEDLTDIFNLVIIVGYSRGSLVQDICIFLHTEHGDK